jgi:putative intracellular protease/amidase
MTTVLIALAGAAKWTMKDGSTLPAGFWAEELINPYQILTAAGTDVALATPNGVAAPLQEYSLDESMTGSAARTAAPRSPAWRARSRIRGRSPGSTRTPSTRCSCRAARADGGPVRRPRPRPDPGRAAGAHGTGRARLPRDHRPALGPRGGTWIFAGYQMTGYTDEEESQGGPGDAAPFTLESRLRAEGAGFTAGAPWSEFTVTDRNLIIGQNPGSAAAVARQLVTALGRQ